MTKIVINDCEITITENKPNSCGGSNETSGAGGEKKKKKSRKGLSVVHYSAVSA
jgi:hypothetical protein